MTEIERIESQVRSKLEELWTCNKKAKVLAEEVNELVQRRKELRAREAERR
jgi:hypothetical protein